MKQLIRTYAAAFSFCLISSSVFAQSDSPMHTPRWVSDKGYWVAESNIHKPQEQTIWFYNNENVLVYKETLTGGKLNLNRGKVKMQLKRVLEASVQSWNATKKLEEDKHYLAGALRKS